MVESDFRRQRAHGIAAIAGSAVVAAGLWFGISLGIAPLAHMDNLTARLVLTAKCAILAVLFCLVTGVEAVAHERLTSPAFDPLVNYETKRLRINKQYLQNTLEQIIVFVAAIFGLALYSPDGTSMRAVIATTAVWIVARFAFWIGYHKSAAMRGLGAPGMAISMIVLLYVVARIGDEVAGVIGAVVPVTAFLAIEAVLFLTTRPVNP